ncbi:tRNA (adenosine(37)-N6)-threonylcarbamoyltransferase complex transferase subunit TsaD [Desulfosarcina ovata]|uniref:tRNA N6-adenosine threonylcarbamoyltransferase n=1 Tax=Desulfosarcina ovata subsp. ovata TaxID=2752305 RepID=A0A5K8AA26_9BACT|nr:tRNA (adenosine(37)-N6)-threonylcarbamoyltransferase complex transferase subunit TsaD [Desulfosarcina ovata]BBO89361.1 tRNA N6-adenosine threonylcarbamoyltransferase [Desulfosarcina ovata subsp. ovata]
MIVLGIESSCDETAAAVVRNGCEVLASVVASQVAVHHPYGGVVPELASRKHIEAIVPVVDQAIAESGIPAKKIDGVAVTQGPGLIGSLLVGFSFAKGFAFGHGIPWVGVDHLEGHINSVFLEADPPAFPFVALLVSGGHTSIYHVTSHRDFHPMGQTRDDAAGEAYDKVAKMLGLGYPGGVVIDRLAAQGDPTKVVFTRPYLDKAEFDFSFSGIKSAVMRHLQLHPDPSPGDQADIAAGFQAAVVDVLTFKIIHAAKAKGCAHLAVVGGVAANRGLREAVTRDAAADGIRVHIPSIELCGDNAAMVAAVGYHRLATGERAGLDDDVYSRVKFRPRG